MHNAVLSDGSRIWPDRTRFSPSHGLRARPGSAARLPNPRIGRTQNYRVETAVGGRVTLRGAPRFEHSDPVGAVHGGWCGTSLENCMSCAVMTGLSVGSACLTLEYEGEHHRRDPDGPGILAEGIVSHSGRTTGVAEGTIRDA